MRLKNLSAMIIANRFLFHKTDLQGQNHCSGSSIIRNSRRSIRSSAFICGSMTHTVRSLWIWGIIWRRRDCRHHGKPDCRTQKSIQRMQPGIPPRKVHIEVIHFYVLYWTRGLRKIIILSNASFATSFSRSEAIKQCCIWRFCSAIGSTNAWSVFALVNAESISLIST